VEFVKAQDASRLSAIQIEIVDFMVRLFRMLGLPKTLGSIYGYVYVNREPVSMDEVMRGLGISAGSASQGLRALKAHRAIRTVFVPGERREWFEAETDFHRFVGNFLARELETYLENTTKRIERISDLLERSPVEDAEFFAERLDQLRDMEERTLDFVPVLEKMFSRRPSPGAGADESFNPQKDNS